MLPFTHAQFLEVFARYNANVWPAQVVAYVLGFGMLWCALRPSPGKSRCVAVGLAAMWLWTGVVYHGLHFSAINRAAILFAALFCVQALLFLRAALRNTLRFGASPGAARWLGGLLTLYATVLYPLTGIGLGQRYAEMPAFGITPCPVTIFTFGILLLTVAPVSRWLLAIPVIWSLIGGSAAFLLQVPQDWPLLLSGLSVIPLLRSSSQGPGPARQPGRSAAV